MGLLNAAAEDHKAEEASSDPDPKRQAGPRAPPPGAEQKRIRDSRRAAGGDRI